MKSRSLYTLRRVTSLLLLACAMAWCMPTGSRAAIRAQQMDKYTSANPLVVVMDWECRPYEYRNDNGEPCGYDVDVVTEVLDNLDIPFVIVMKDWQGAMKMFGQKKADIIISKNRLPYPGLYYGQTILASYQEGIAYRANEEAPTDYKRMGKDRKVGFKNKDYVQNIGRLLDTEFSHPVTATPQHGLHMLNNGEIDYYICGANTLKWVINEMKITDVEITSTGMPSIPLKFTTHSKELRDLLDDQFARLDQAGKIKKIVNKWFHPEIYERDASPVVIYLIAGALVILLVHLILNHLINKRIAKRTETIKEQNKLLAKALELSNNYVVRHDFATHTIHNIYGNLVPKEGIRHDDYLSRVHPDDRGDMLQYSADMKSGKINNKENNYRFNLGTPEQPEWHSLKVQSISETDRYGKLTASISTVIDITEEQEAMEANEKLTEKYINIFEQSLVGLSLYDNTGKLVSVNATMRRIFHFENDEDKFYFDLNLYDLPFLKNNVKRYQPVGMHFCTQIHIPERKMYDYLEIKMRPIKDEEGQLKFVMLTARNITEDYKLYKESKVNEKRLASINKKVKQYEANMRYLMEVNQMRVWRSSLVTKEVAYFKDLYHYEYKFTFEEFMSKLTGEVRDDRLQDMLHPDQNTKSLYKSLISAKNLFVIDNKEHWYNVNSIPERDAEGTVIGYFGLIRDVTTLMEKQAALRNETFRANESGKQKSAFLANMTHEIRTPLNAIVGFCDLLQAIDAPEERKEFTRIIRNNCDMLLQLINDILDISTMDSNSQVLQPHDVDFSAAFDDICTTLATRVTTPGVQYLCDNPYPTYPTVMDSGRIQQVITNFVTNAVKYTQQGHIKVGYREEGGGLYVYCEDTGTGIPKDKCEKVFDRFVKLNDFIQGTGLGLSICKAIIDQCHGKIGVNSEEGKGSTFWFWIPCPRKG